MKIRQSVQEITLQSSAQCPALRPIYRLVDQKKINRQELHGLSHLSSKKQNLLWVSDCWSDKQDISRRQKFFLKGRQERQQELEEAKYILLTHFLIKPEVQLEQ